MAEVKKHLTSALRRALLPLKVLWYGHLPLLTYYVVCIALSLFLLTKLTYLINNQAAVAQIDREEASAFVEALRQALNFLCWLSLVPILTTVFCLPAKSIWTNKRLNFFEVCGQSPLGIIKASRSCYLSLRTAIWLLVPVLAIVMLFSGVLDTYANEKLFWLCATAATVVAFFNLYRVSPLLLSPLLSLAGDASPQDALNWSFELLNSKRPAILTNLLLASGVALGIIKVSSFSSFGLLHEGPIRAGIGVCLLWYLITGYTILILEACVERINLNKQIAEQHVMAQALEQQRIIQAAQLQMQASQAPQQQLNADFKVTKVWVEKE